MFFSLKHVQLQLYGPPLLHDGDVSLVSMTVALLGIRSFCRGPKEGHLSNQGTKDTEASAVLEAGKRVRQVGP